MFIYVIFAAVVGIVAGIVMATRTKKADGITYGALDKAGRITNIILTVIYAGLSPFYMFLGMISEGYRDGILGVLGWIVAIIIASAALICGLGIGASVALRKKGKSVLSFAVQFAGVIAIALAFVLYALFVGVLIRPLN